MVASRLLVEPSDRPAQKPRRESARQSQYQLRQRGRPAGSNMASGKARSEPRRIATVRFMKCTARSAPMVLALTLLAGCGSSGSHGWVADTFHDVSVTVRVDHPKAWSRQLEPSTMLEFDKVLGFLGSFPMSPYCTDKAGATECALSSIGPLPEGGVVVVADAISPSKVAGPDLLVGGQATVVDGRPAVIQPTGRALCVGTGADHERAVAIRLGPAPSTYVLRVSVCWRGADPKTASDAQRLTENLKVTVPGA
jgi:hypothetical protein